jgi:hypothetical protein
MDAMDSDPLHSEVQAVSNKSGVVRMALFILIEGYITDLPSPLRYNDERMREIPQ